MVVVVLVVLVLFLRGGGVRVVVVGVAGGAAPPFANTFITGSGLLKTSLYGAKRSRGVGEGAAPPPICKPLICKQTACMMT